MKPTKNATVLVTKRCNWSCDYCDIPGAERKSDAKESHIIDWLDKITVAHERVSLSGGEIGLLSDELLNMIFGGLLKKVNVNTNGTFVERGLYERYKDKISSLTVHASCQMDDVPVALVPGSVGKNVLVVTKANIGNLDQFLARWSEHDFEIRLFEPKRTDGSDAAMALSRSDVNEICKIATTKHGNVTNSAEIWQIHANFNDRQTYVSLCKDRVTMYDLVEGKAYGCCKSASHQTRAISNEAIFKGQVIVDDRACASCLTCMRKSKQETARSVLGAMLGAIKMSTPRGMM